MKLNNNYRIKWFLPLFLLVILTSFNYKVDRTTFGNIALLQKNFSENNEDTLAKIVIEIAGYSRVDSKAIGVSGITTEQYLRYESLAKIASDSQLIKLTDHDSASVKVYAFWALLERGYNVIPILEKHLCDKQPFQFGAGCSRNRSLINVHFLQKLEFKLTGKEFESYKQQLSLCFSHQEWTLIRRLAFRDFSN